MTQTEGDWFPSDVDTSSGSEKYLNVKKLDIGKECRVRILSQAVSGQERWGMAPGDKKDRPYRVRKGFPFPSGITWQKEKSGPTAGEEQRAMDFIAFAVWDYESGRVRIMQLTQRGLMKSLRDLATSGDWGPPTNYDVGITRKDESGKVAYALQAKPPKALDKAIAAEWALLKTAGFNLDAIFSGGDPFPETVSGAPAASDEDLPF